MKQYDVYVFDFDGTLCDSKESLYQVFEDCFAAVGIYGITHEQCEEFMHHSLLAVAQDHGVYGERYQTFLDACIKSIDRRETIEKSKTYDDVIETVQKLKNNGKTLAISSGNTSKHIQDVIEFLKWPKVFSAFMGSDIYKHPKPDKEPIWMCLELLHHAPDERVCYVGDSMQDMESAKNAGVDGILVDRNNAYPDYDGIKIKSLKELL